MPRIIDATTQLFDGEGLPLSGGKLLFTIPGTSTLKATYSDSDLVTLNTNPVILDSEGRVPDVFGEGSYRLTWSDADDLQIGQKDPVPGGLESAGQFAVWLSYVTYPILAIVTASDGLYYRSKVSNNLGNDPSDVANAAYWTEVLRNLLDSVRALGSISGSNTIDLILGNVVTATIGGNTTIVLDNPYIESNYADVMLKLTNAGAYTITWPTINWVKSDGSLTTTFSQNETTLQTAGTDFIFLWTVNGGTTYYGKIVR